MSAVAHGVFLCRVHFAKGLIEPCGISDDDKAVTSMEKELGQKLDIERVKTQLKDAFASLFEYEYAPAEILP